MVRVNLINPQKLADQHLIAEYNEILMLIAYIKKYSKTNLDKIPNNYSLGKGHILFFKNKVLYLKNRHEKLKKEMNIRGFKTRKTVYTNQFSKNLLNNYKPNNEDKKIIKKRLIEKLKLKPNFYRYYSKNKSERFFINLINKSN